MMPLSLSVDMRAAIENRLLSLRNPTFWLVLAGVSLVVALGQTVLLGLPDWQSDHASVRHAVPTSPSHLVSWPTQARQIPTWHVFGKAPPPPSALPETNLQLALVGIMQASLPALSQAIIATPSGQEKVYSVGEAVPGGATIQAIHGERIILNRNGLLEELPLPRDPLKFNSWATVPTLGSVSN